MYRVKAILLDLDGTVADTHELIFHCFSDTLLKHVGRACSRAVWEKAVGLPLDDGFVAALEHLGEPSVSPAVLARSYRARLTELDGAVTAFPGVPETLQALRQRGIRLAIVTTKHQPAVSRHLGLLEIAHLVDAVITGDQCSRCKPDPEPFARAAAALDVAPEETAGVGDSPYDVQSARAADALAVAACWGTTNREALLTARPDRVLEAPADLLSLLEGEV